jgi:hypothetical protein
MFSLPVLLLVAAACLAALSFAMFGRDIARSHHSRDRASANLARRMAEW